MSLYNALHGMNPFSFLILKVLNVDEKDIERFRDASMDLGANLIEVLARTGGPNAEAWPNRILRDHPWFAGVEDVESDHTYCVFRFRIPPVIAKAFAGIAGTAMNETTLEHPVFLELKSELEESGCAHVPGAFVHFARVKERLAPERVVAHDEE